MSRRGKEENISPDVIEDLDTLAEQALENYKQGRTKSIEQLAEELCIKYELLDGGTAE